MRQISGTPIPLLIATLLLTSASWASESTGEATACRWRRVELSRSTTTSGGRSSEDGTATGSSSSFGRWLPIRIVWDKITLKTREGPEQTRISVRFDDHVSESAYLEIHAPRSLGILVWGTHSAIELHGLEGPVQAWTLSGLLTSENVTSSVSLRSQSGDILFRTRNPNPTATSVWSRSGENNLPTEPGSRSPWMDPSRWHPLLERGTGAAERIPAEEPGGRRTASLRQQSQRQRAL